MNESLTLILNRAKCKLCARYIPGVISEPFTHLTENCAAQELIASGHSNLYYWTSGNLSEIDFILSYDENIYPFEINSGLNTKTKSLKVYKEKYKLSILSRSSLRNFSNTGNMHDYPLYAVSLFPIRK